MKWNEIRFVAKKKKSELYGYRISPFAQMFHHTRNIYLNLTQFEEDGFVDSFNYIFLIEFLCEFELQERKSIQSRCNMKGEDKSNCPFHRIVIEMNK